LIYSTLQLRETRSKLPRRHRINVDQVWSSTAAWQDIELTDGELQLELREGSWMILPSERAVEVSNDVGQGHRITRFYEAYIIGCFFHLACL
jgi:hypothetical protein